MKKDNMIKTLSQVTMGLVTVTLSLFAGNAAYAAATDISTAPIFTSVPAAEEVKPNVMFVLDDSGSMGWRFMPDEAWDFNDRKGELASQCNAVFYDPTTTYDPPVNADGSSFPDADFFNAPWDGFDNPFNVDLSTEFDFAYNGPAQANYFVYNGTQTTANQKTYRDGASTFYQECDQARGTASASWTRVFVSATSGIGGTDERTNFANWFTYYRTRMLMMKTSAGRAFNQFDDSYRIGYLTLNNSSPNNDFLNINDFDVTQKANWYTKLYEAVPNSGTPLRETLAEAGLVFSGRANTINGVTVTDPVQFACQQNYTILSTDGYWNGNDGFKLDGTTSVGNQDGTLPLPYNDGGFFSKDITTTHVTTEDRTTVTSGYTTTETYQASNNVYGATCTTPATTSAPNNAATAYITVRGGFNRRRGAVGYSATNPAGNGPNAQRCVNLGPSAWFCRSNSFFGLPAVSQSTVTDDNGDTWYLVSNGANQNGDDCTSAREAWGNAYRNGRGVCKGTTVPGVAGRELTVDAVTRTREITGRNSTEVDRYIATQVETQTGVTPLNPTGTTTPLTPPNPLAPADFVFDSQVSSTSTPGTPGAFSSTTNSTVNMGCVANADLPGEGVFAETLVSSVDSAGTASETVTRTGPVITTTETVSNQTDGTDDTLADVAAYYYNTDLREWDGTGTMPAYCVGPIPLGETQPRNLCLPNKVPTGGKDTEESQHMTTFTLGLGAQGEMVFIPEYETDTTGDYDHVAKGKTKSATTCSWTDALTFTGGRCNWPVPEANEPTTIDDLWHAAINGHGSYFNAKNPQDLTTALNSTLTEVTNAPRPGSASAAATTSPQITSANNYRFSSYFKSVEWTGELIRQEIDLATGLSPAYDHARPDANNYDWSAQGLLDAQVYTTRNIYTKSETGNTRIAFNWANLTAARQAYFQAPHISTAPPAFPNPLTGLAQFCTGAGCLSTADQTNAQGQPLVDFIRGDRTNEDLTVSTATKYYRKRAHVLGDIVSAEPTYVGAPDFDYTDTGYAAFKTTNANRQGIVYAAANDGMLHAFNADTGAEEWAYIPSFVLPRLYTLADKQYASKHQFFVEGTPATGDVYDPTTATWKTILVGGLNAGGVGYYALDITNPANPIVLWEFTDTDMGYTFGNPSIVKLDTGAWAVTFTSAYNNCPSASATHCAKNGVGDGKGHLYVLNALGGNLVTVTSDINTGEGTATAPSGLAKTLTVDLNSDGFAESAYGGDLFGNVWRFDFGTGGYTKTAIATLRDANGDAQPITARPEAGKIDGYAIVYIGTGRYLGTGDVDYTQVQSFYALKDTGTNYGNIRTDTNNFIRYQAVDATCTPTAPTNDVGCIAGQPIRKLQRVGGADGDSLRNKNGWYVDLPTGEITFTTPLLVSGTIVFTTSVPKSTTTEVCGSPTGDDARSFLWQLDFIGRGSIGDTVAATYIGKGIATRPKYMLLPGGKQKITVKNSDGVDTVEDLKTSGTDISAKRFSWRELLEDE